MEEMATVIETLLDDRGFRKVRINLIKNNRIFGFIKPL